VYEDVEQDRIGVVVLTSLAYRAKEVATPFMAYFVLAMDQMIAGFRERE
jgi:hypothetical protein